MHLGATVVAYNGRLLITARLLINVTRGRERQRKSGRARRV